MEDTIPAIDAARCSPIAVVMLLKRYLQLKHRVQIGVARLKKLHTRVVGLVQDVVRHDVQQRANRIDIAVSNGSLQQRSEIIVHCIETDAHRMQSLQIGTGYEPGGFANRPCNRRAPAIRLRIGVQQSEYSGETCRH